MIVGVITSEHISFVLVFLEGLLSFFSPCVIPLIPVYMSFLAGNAKKVAEEGVIQYERKKVFLHTLFFVLGISFAFFILGLSFTALGRFFNDNKMLFTRLGGILIIALGLYQLGILEFSFMQKEKKIHLDLTEKKVNPLIALLLGFTFSFAWTPCIGPILSSVLIMASGAKTALAGNFLVLVYTIGFVLPFLLLGLFTTQVLDFLKSKQNLLRYAIKAGGILLLIMGIMTFTGWMNGISGYLNSISSSQQNKFSEAAKNNAGNDNQSNNTNKSDSANNTADNASNSNNRDNTDTGDTSNTQDSENENTKNTIIPAFDFTLTDQYGNEHTLSDYKGKVVFLNFWASWCPPCKEELPHIEELYQEYSKNEDEVIFLGITNPKNEDYPYNQDEEKDKIISFMDKNGYTFPTLFDETGEILHDYYISAFPTTFMIDKEGNIYGYVPGMMTKDMMKNVIDQTLKSTD
ncbi:redoxin domain-containing protein [Anaerocolumna sedimenticola]|uniref:Redoxin domain-containing protein n=1 Tax=Anaerocolumna sedimenticola TaxID=2696063 RepID=A0A6P1TIF2_9FIRM|nr:cytochrome c biogenesis protein CcdA [Anaerocolumna sedimenticola]QHQ60914.1 redoxin domain-containing protein [Anaerocolumna sedimenticola]